LSIYRAPEDDVDCIAAAMAITFPIKIFPGTKMYPLARVREPVFNQGEGHEQRQSNGQ